MSSQPSRITKGRCGILTCLVYWTARLESPVHATFACFLQGPSVMWKEPSQWSSPGHCSWESPQGSVETVYLLTAAGLWLACPAWHPHSRFRCMEFPLEMAVLDFESSSAGRLPACNHTLSSALIKSQFNLGLFLAWEKPYRCQRNAFLAVFYACCFQLFIVFPPMHWSVLPIGEAGIKTWDALLTFHFNFPPVMAQISCLSCSDSWACSGMVAGLRSPSCSPCC